MTVPLIVLAVGSACLGLLLGSTAARSRTGWSRSSGEHREEHPVLAGPGDHRR